MIRHLLTRRFWRLFAFNLMFERGFARIDGRWSR